MDNPFDAAGRVAPMRLEIGAGTVTLRPETGADTDFLFTVFRSHVLPELAAMPVDDATRETLVAMQFHAQTMGYRGNYPDARFDIVLRDDVPIGRIVLDPGIEAGCVVDFALAPDIRGRGLGTAIMTAVIAAMAPLGRPVQCKVLMTNAASLRMCLRAGFQQTEAIPPFLQLEWRPA